MRNLSAYFETENLSHVVQALQEKTNLYAL